MSRASDTLSTYHTSVLELLLPREGVAAVDLRPAGDAGKHLVASRLTRRVPIQILDEQRPRADQTHVTAHHVPELRQLIETQCAQHAAERGEPLGIRLELSRTVPLERHRAELVEPERSCAKPRPLLGEDHRAAERRGDAKRYERDDRHRDGERRHREHEVQQALAASPIKGARRAAFAPHDFAASSRSPNLFDPVGAEAGRAR